MKRVPHARTALTAIVLVGLVAAADHAAVPTDRAHATLAAPPVQVLVHKDARPGAVTYRYRVVNGSAFEITTLLVGYDYFTNSPELRLAPIGWNGDSVPSTSARSPAGWHFAVIQTEEDSLVNLEWAIDTLATGMLGGTTGLFEVTLPAEDPRYASGHWVVYLNSASQIYYVGNLESAATPAPRVSLFGPNGVKIRPNPTGEGVIIEFSTSAAAGCTIDVLDAKGRQVRRMFLSFAKAGTQRTEWDGRDDQGDRRPPAAYFAHIQAPTLDAFARFTLGP